MMENESVGAVDLAEEKEGRAEQGAATLVAETGMEAGEVVVCGREERGAREDQGEAPKDEAVATAGEDAGAAASERTEEAREEAAATALAADVAERLYDSMEPPKVGDIISGRVVGIEDSSVLVDVGYKSEGVIHISELSFRYLKHPSEAVSLGQEINVMVLSVNGRDGTLRLSKKRAEERLAWDMLEAALEQNAPVEARVVQEVKGGLVADVGVRAFIPASQVERGYVNDLSPYVGQTLKFKILELDSDKGRVILSRRRLLEEELQKLREQTWNAIREGEVRRGVVKGITDFGAFVDVGGVDGLLHISELSWKRVSHPSEVVREGQEIDVMVLRVDREKGKISLGLKQVLPDPWENVELKYPVGSVVEGNVTRLAPFGAFVELEDGIEGLVHVSELSGSGGDKPEDSVKPGDRVRVKILRVRPKDRRISLSMRGIEQPAGSQQHGPDPEPGSVGHETVTLGDVFGDLLKKEAASKEAESEG